LSNSYAIDGKLAFSVLGDTTLKSQDNSIVRYISEIELGHKINIFKTKNNLRLYTNIQTYMDSFEESLMEEYSKRD
jgi:hypothetical protein